MIPSYLTSTLELLRVAFSAGISDSEYLPLLAALHPHMSDRNLAVVVADFTGKDPGIVQNDVYKAAAGGAASAEAVAAVQSKLDAAGFVAWVKSEDEEGS